MNPQQLHLKLQTAVKAFNDGDLKKSEKLLEQYVKESPNEFDPTHLLAVVYAHNSKHHNAIKFYKIALRINPDDAQALSNFATSLNAIGNNQEALSSQEKAIKLDPNNPEFWYNAGNILCDLKKYDASFQYYEKALILNPYSYQTLNNYGKALYDLKRFSESISYYSQALQFNPNYQECLINYGVSLKELKRFNESIECFDKALMLNPGHAEAWSNKGIVLCMLKKYDEAIDHFDKALTLKPNYAEAWSNKGVILHHELKRLEDSLSHHNRALELKPNYAEAWSNKGSVLNDLNRYDQALFCYQQALVFKPDFDWLYGNLLHTKMKLCDWSSFETDANRLFHGIALNEKIAQPFVPLFLSDNPKLHKQCAESYIADLFPPNISLGKNLPKETKSKIRIGYFSADLGKHAVSALAVELFELHDKNHFEIIAFSFGLDDKSVMRTRTSKAFDHFIDAKKLSDKEVSELAREMGVDIAVDLGGFTGDNRIGPFPYRAAPIQVNYLGYPGTTGAEYIDYIIADKILIPPDLHQHYSEKVIYLPNSYQANDRKRLISDNKFTRQELNLPENGFVFACFNNNYKILPTIFASWMRILKSVEGSVLWLLQDNLVGAKNLKEIAKKFDISEDRLIFATRTSPPEHLARHCHADLFLDTFPYNAHTTASDSLWAGLPILTLKGESFASRVAASLLTAINLPELITSSPEEYEALAIELATNPQKLATLRQALAENRTTAPLFNTPLFTTHLESAYLKMYERYQMGLEPDHLFVD